MVSRNTWALCLFLTFSVILIEKSLQTTTCEFYKYKKSSYLYYNHYYGRTTTNYRRQETRVDKFCKTSCCSYDCCDNYTDYIYYYYKSTITAGAIAGIVIGSLIGLAIVISIIIACCLGCRRRQFQQGQIVSATSQNVTYIHATQPSIPGQVVVGGTYPQHPCGVQPPEYSYLPTIAGNPTVNASGNPATGSSTNAIPNTSAPPPPYSTLQ